MGRFLLVSLSLLVVTLSLNGIGADHHCPSYWISLGKFCYKVIREWKTWEDAKASCVQLHHSSHLASIHSREESRYITQAISRSLVIFTDVWIGLSDPGKNRTWEWTDGSDFDYTSWGIFEPGNADRGNYCTKLSRVLSKPGWRRGRPRGTSHRRYRWKAAKCESKNFFICKM